MEHGEGRKSDRDSGRCGLAGRIKKHINQEKLYAKQALHKHKGKNNFCADQ